MCSKQPCKHLAFLFLRTPENLDTVTHCGNALYLGTFVLSEVERQCPLVKNMGAQCGNLSL